MTSQTPLPKASTRETLVVYGEVLIPTIAKGAIIRRPRIVGLSQRLGLDDRAGRWMQKLEESYGACTILLNVPIKSQAVVLSPEDVHAVLEGAPRPFDPATDEKRAALSHFEPCNALISSGMKREIRCEFNEDVFGTGPARSPPCSGFHQDCRRGDRIADRHIGRTRQDDLG